MRGKRKRKKQTGFKPPIKASGEVSLNVSTSSVVPDKTHKVPSNSSSSGVTNVDTEWGGVYHTLLSYCDDGEDEAEDHSGVDMNTQPLSMFSGERIETEKGDNVRDLDDPFFPLDDPLSQSNNTHCTENSKLDDSLNDPTSLLSSSSPVAAQDCCSGEQIVPISDQGRHSKDTGGRVDGVENESGDDSEREGDSLFPRRQFRVPRSSRCYNLDLLPKHYTRNSRKTTRARARPSVNWTSSISILEGGEGTGARGEGDARHMSVYEVPLSAGDGGGHGRETRHAGKESRANQSLSKLDLSLSNRTRQEQVIIIV